MKINVYIPSDNLEHVAVLEAFAKGIKASGAICDVRNVNNYEPSDIAVVFGVGKKNVPCSYARGIVIEQQAHRGRSTIVLEKGYVKRDRYYAAGWNGLNGRANFRNSGMPPDRWRELETELHPYQPNTPEKKILVIGQVPSDASVQNVDIVQWCSHTVLEIKKKIPNREIIFRPHPLASKRTPSILHATRSTQSLEEDLRDAVYAVTYNSNVGVDAVIAGVPVYVADKGAMAYDVASKKLGEAYMPTRKVIEQWAHNLAYTQWTLDEMREGLPWLHLTKTESMRAAR